MIAQISHTGNTSGIIMYHDKKMQNGVATILDSHNINTSSRNNIQTSINSYNAFSNEKRPTVHISINFHAEDRPKLTDQTYREISKKYLLDMGYSEQPYIVYKHKDQAHPHIHIVTSRIKDNGNKIPNWGERYRSQNISRNLEISYDLKEVSSIKNTQKETVKLENEKEYLSYIRSGVKEALSLRPKRKEDLEMLLSTHYGIQLYHVKNKGTGFALIGENHARYSNGYGTKGIAGSKIDTNWSAVKIKETLSNNFDNAPKRYRNLKATQGILKQDLSYFDSISKIDFDAIFIDTGTVIHQEEKRFLVLDTKGKNIYSERDLKDVNFSLVSKTTNLKDPTTSGLFKKIGEETFWLYKNEYSRKLLASKFIEDIADKKSFINGFEESPTFKRFKAILNEHQLDKITAYLSKYFELLPQGLDEFIRKEDFEREELGKVVHAFSAISNTNENGLRDKLRLDIFSQNYSPSSIERGVFSIMDKVVNPDRKSKVNEYFNPNIIFDIDRYIDRGQLPNKIGLQLDELLASKYIDASIYSVKKSTTSPESFVKSLNDKGVVLSKDVEAGGKILASIPLFKYKTAVKGIESFLSNIDFKNLDVPQNFDDIRFRKAIDNNNMNYAFSLMANEKLSDQTFDQYKNLEAFKPLWKERQLKEDISNSLWNFKSDNQIVYTSDLKLKLKENPAVFLNHTEFNKEIPENWAKEYLATYTSNESISESIRFEKEHFTNTIELSNQMNNGNISALIGLKNSGNDLVTDLNGKYEIDGNIIYPKSIETLQQQPYFNYYSNIFNEVSFHLYGDNRDTYKLDYSNILVYESFKSHIPDEYKKDYQKIFEKSYVDYFTQALSEKGSSWSDNEKIDYLNSKGLLAVHLRGDTFLKLGASENLFKGGEDIGFKNISLEKQSNYLRNNGFNDRGTRRTEQLRFVVAIEKENYTGAAWLLKQNKVSLTLSNVESNRFGKLKELLDKLDKDTDSLSKSIVNTMKQEEGGDGHYKGSKSKKNKRKKGPRL